MLRVIGAVRAIDRDGSGVYKVGKERATSDAVRVTVGLGAAARESILAAMPGYSGTPLPKKLGIKPAHRLVLLNAPNGLDGVLGELPEGVKVSRTHSTLANADTIMLFITRLTLLDPQVKVCAKRIVSNGAVWVCWPKRTSGVKTDVTENLVRDVALSAGLVDNKVCAIDDTWSALRCVIRLKDRPK